MKNSIFKLFSPKLLVMLLPLFILSSCATETMVLKKGYDFNKIKRVAVLQFKEYTFTRYTGSMVSQLFVKYMLKAGYNVVERDELDAILRERQLSESNLLDPSQVRTFKLSGIDAIVTGAITREIPEQDLFENGNPRFIAAQVGITCRMIDVETGEILWAGSDTYDGTNTQTAFEYLTSSMVRNLIDDIRTVSAGK
ncbi:MAG: CsgG/HfaB family protein [Elusimicrobiota bacterium]